MKTMERPPPSPKPRLLRPALDERALRLDPPSMPPHEATLETPSTRLRGHGQPLSATSLERERWR